MSAGAAVDPQQLATFVDALFRYADEDTWISLRAFRDDVDHEPPIAIQGVPMNGDLGRIAEAAVKLARFCAAHQHPVVFCPPICTLSNKDKATEAALRNGLALSVELDSDAEGARKRLEFLLGPATVVVASGGTYTDLKTGEVKPKLHVHWRLKEPTRDPEAHKCLKRARALATALVGGDASNKPVVHPIRWPGSVHRKGEPKLCRIVAIIPDAEVDLQDAISTLLDIQPEFRKADSSGGATPGDGEDRETAELVRALMAGEDFHATLLALAMRFLKRGMAAEHVVTTLRGLMQAVPQERRDGDHPGRWQARYGDIPRMVRQAKEKLGEAAQATGWPDPIPLPQGLPPVDPFPIELLPDAFAPWVADVAERMQVPPDYVAVSAMVAAGSAIGRQIGIHPKRHDDWLVIANLWGAVIGRPGLLKTPALEEALRPIKAMECEAKAAHESETKIWETRSEIEREAKKLRAGKIREQLKGHRNPDNLAREIADEQAEIPEPVRRRFITNDPTVPKLGEILRDNPRGVLVFRDELMGWLRIMEQEGRDGERAFYLEAWNGTGRFTYDRIGRGTVDIEAACVSVLGGIQPGPLLAYLESKAWDSAGDDGLLQRLQLAVWPDPPATWRNVDRRPNVEARDLAAAVFQRLAAIAPDAALTDGIPALRFDDDAQEAFDGWRAGLEEKLRAGHLHPAFEAHLSKYRSLLPSLALVCHLVDGGGQRVGMRAFYRAEAWIEYLETHAARVYDALLKADQAAAKALGEHIAQGDLPSPFSLRDVYRHHWTELTTAAAAQEAAEILCDLWWLRVEEVQTGGRPSQLYHINPAVRTTP